MPPTILAARPIVQSSAPLANSRSLPLLEFRQAALNALFPFLIDSWLTEQRLFFRQLGYLIQAGIPLHQALGSALQTSRSTRLKLPLTDAVQTVAEGGRLSDSFGRYPEVFSELQIELLRAGEAGGFLERVLDQITIQIEKELELRRFLSQQTLYSKIILIFALIVLPVMLTIVFGGNVLGALLRPIVDFAQLAILCALVFTVGRSLLHRSPAAREIYEMAKWRIPGVGTVSRTYAIARFGHSLSCLYEAGVPIASALRTAGKASGSYRVLLMAEQASLAAERGESFVPVMRTAGIMHEDTLHMIETGLSTGEVGVMVARAAEYLEVQADNKAQQAAYIFSTIFFLLVAMYVTRGISNLANSTFGSIRTSPL
jgi:type IV pilus assembly protein PilC